MTGFEIAALALSAFGTVQQVSSAQSARNDAKAAAEAQAEQARLQARLENARRRRAARIQSASTIASSGGQGATGSLVSGALQGIESNLQSNLDLSAQQLSLQEQQFDIAAAQTANQANATIAASLGTFAADALSVAEKKWGV